MSFVPLCRCHVLFYAFLHNFAANSRICDVCMTEFAAKILQVIYFAPFFIRCEAKFCKVRLEIFKCTCVKCLLD